MEFITDLVAARAALTPDRPAMEELMSRRRVTYRMLDAGAAQAAGALEALGVGAEDRVAVLCRNRIAFFELLLGAAKLGAILVPLNWRAPAPELQPLIDDAAPTVLVYGAEDEAVARSLGGAKLRHVGLDDLGPEGWEALCAAAAPAPGRPRWPTAQCWYLLYTSGTTGAPKAVVQTYAMALANYVNLRQAIALGPDDVTLNYLPLFHTAGINLHTLPTLIAGGLSLVLPGFDAAQTLALVVEGRLTAFFGVPAVYQQLALTPGFDTADLGAVRSWSCGGAPLPDALVHVYAAKGVRVCNGYGMTETGPTTFLMDAARVLEKVGSVGRAQLLVEAKAMRADGAPAAIGEDGELWLRGPGITPGYWRKPAETAAAFTEEGWLKTGDLARQDRDGDWRIVGRAKEMFISGGENVYPAEVENVLALHPDILEAAVVGAPDPDWGEVGVAFVMARPGRAVDPSALDAFCRSRLAGFKAPRRFVPVSDFPRTPAGKVRKHLLSPPA